MHMHTLLFLFLLLWYHKAMKHGTYTHAADNPLGNAPLAPFAELILSGKYMGINGVLAASPIADTLAFIMSVSMVILSFRHLNELSPKHQN